MVCSNPYMAGAIPLGCGKCVHCHTNRARLWAWRQYIEYLTCGQAAFVTLTYNEKYLPMGGRLKPKDVQLWLKRFRKYISPARVRYFLVGEYGEESNRPHYHASLFGVHWAFRYKDKSLTDIVDRTWGRGLVHVGEFNIRTAHYVTGYLTKSLRDRDKGRKYVVPEFTRMSRRPGLGYYGVSILAKSLHDIESVREGEVPFVVRADGKKQPLGRYLRDYLIRELNVQSEVEVEKDIATHKKSSELYAMLRADITIPSLKEVYRKSVQGLLAKNEALYAIYSKKGTL